MITDKKITLHWVGNIKDYYISKGYTYTKQLDEFVVDIKDLNSICNVKVNLICDDCGKKFERSFNKVCDCKKHYCKKCSYNHHKDKKKKYNDKYKMKQDLLYLLNNTLNGNVEKGFVHDMSNKYGLADWSIYKKMFNVNNLLELFDTIGFKLKSEDSLRIKTHTKNTLSKEEVIEIIYNMQLKLNRPLMYDDFRSPKEGEVGITTIKKHWGTMNNMKKELGIEVNQENMISKHIDDFNIIKDEIIKCCLIIKEKYGRNIIQYSDIEEINSLKLNPSTINKYCKQNNTSIRDIVGSIGFELQSEGNGLVHTYEDGERIKSSYELNFSNKLKELGLIYKKDYCRDVRYRTFISDYNGLLDCDYEIHINDRIVYIEIAGMLRDYKNKYKTPELITNSKSKRKYAEKLNIKEQMLIDNNLGYYILFPSDLKDLDKLFSDILKIEKKGNDE